MKITDKKVQFLCSLLLLVNAQAHSAYASEEKIPPIIDASNFITKTSACHALGSELNVKTGIHFPDLTESVFESLHDAGWSSQDLAEALTLSQDALPEIPRHPDETQAQYLTRLYDSKFRCSDINRAYFERIAGSIPEKPEITK